MTVGPFPPVIGLCGAKSNEKRFGRGTPEPALQGTSVDPLLPIDAP